MGLIDRLFPRWTKGVEAKSYFKLLNGYTPVFHTWNGRIYESELVRAAIDAKARHISKLQFVQQGEARPKLKNLMRNAPNSWQTWSQFLYRTATILEARNTCFIIPVIDRYGDTIGICSIAPESWELVIADNGEPWLRFRFENGGTRAIGLSRVGIMTKFQYTSDFFGENNAALHDTMELINIQRQGIEESAKNSASYRFMARLGNFLNDADITKERMRFDKETFASSKGGGLLLFPNTYTDIKELSNKQYAVNSAQMELIQRNVFTYFGVNDKVLQNAATGDDLDAFFNGAIEPFSIQLSDVVTRMLFTDREQSFGNKIMFVANRLQYMSTSAKIEMAAQLGDRGILMIDEIRELFNYAPLPDNAGQHAPIRGEYYMVDEGKDPKGDSDGNKE